MATTPQRVVDAHIHLWDPAREDWYPFLAGQQDVGLGDVSGMARYFDASTYFAEAAEWNVESFVHVGAAARRFAVEETLEREAWADDTGNPAAIVGSMYNADTVGEILAPVDAQATATRFRGVRALRFEHGVPPTDVLRELADRSLVLDLMVHPEDLRPAAHVLEAFPQLTVVVEHTGWPTSTDEDERERWRAGMAALASLGDNVVCKLSGLAMPLGAMSVDAFRPWIEHAITLFGSDRAMFASNFPVDGLHGTFDQLYGVYAALTDALESESRDQLFAGTAERVYRI
ncbi:MAG: amidohydrolase family protein [Actinomycetota bacterium]